MTLEDVIHNFELAYACGRYSDFERAEMAAILRGYREDDFSALYAAVRKTFSSRFKRLPGPAEITEAVEFARSSDNPIRRKESPTRATWQGFTPEEIAECERDRPAVEAAFAQLMDRFRSGGGACKVFHGPEDLKTPQTGVGE